MAAVHAAEDADDQPAADQPEDDRPGSEALPAELGFGVDRFLDGIEAWAAAKARG